jgi:hypothetical protein
MAKLRKRITPEMESLFGDSARVQPGGMTVGTNKIVNKGQSVDLGRIEKMIHDDFSELEKKLDLISNKLNNNKMSNVEVAKLNNQLASVKKHSVMKK